jgi:hypothetical protein
MVEGQFIPPGTIASYHRLVSPYEERGENMARGENRPCPLSDSCFLSKKTVKIMSRAGSGMIGNLEAFFKSSFQSGRKVRILKGWADLISAC